MIPGEVFLQHVGYDNINSVSDPASGADYAAPLTSGVRQQILGMRFQLVTDATVADRRVQVELKFNNTTYIVSQANVVQPASLTITYFLAAGYVASTAIVDTKVLMRWPYPPELLGSGTSAAWQIATDVVNLQAGDQLQNMSLYVRSAVGGPA